MSTGLNPLSFIKANSLSYTEIQNDLEEFIAALSEDEKLGFKTLFEGTNSQILIELLAAKTSDELYHIINSRNENLLFYANRQDSAIAIAQNDAYSTFRGSNIKLSITIVPYETVTIPKMSSIGNAGDDYDLIVAEDIYLTRGTATTITAYVGHVKSEELTSDTNELAVFRFTNKNISDQIALYLDGTEDINEVPLSTNILDMINNKYFCMTNAYGGVDVMYLNTSESEAYTHKYQNGSKFTLKYIELEDIAADSFEVFSPMGNITKLEQVTTYLEPESLDSIRHKSALYSEVQNRVVARDDFQKVMLNNYPILADADGKDYSNAQVQVTYVKKNGELLTTSEYDEIYADLSSRRSFGIPMCLIVAPTIIRNLSITTYLQLNYSISANTESYIKEILSEYENNLGAVINFGTIEHDIEGLDFVKVARIKLNTSAYVQETPVYSGMIFRPTNDSTYACIVKKVLALTGNSEPSWPTTIGATVIDNKVKWQCEQKSYTAQQRWSANTSKFLGNVVWPTNNAVTYQYRCVGYNYLTGAEEPVWPTVKGAVVIDNEIVWKAVTLDTSAATWAPSTSYEVGKIINRTPPSEEGEEITVSYQAINYATTLPVEPTWPDYNTTFTNGNIEYAVLKNEFNINSPNAFSIVLDWNQYCTFDLHIGIV